MASNGSELFNPVTRTRVVFVAAPSENGGRAIAVDWFVPPGEMLPGRPHYHAGPAGEIAERFEIITGTASCTVNGRRLDVRAPTVIDIPFGAVHIHPANTGDGELHVRQSAEFDPPRPDVLLRLESFFETLMALSQQNRVRRNGDIRDPLQLALTFHESLLDPTFLPGLPKGTQKALFGGLARLARALGYKASHHPQWKSPD